MLTYLDLIQKDDFRNYASERIASDIENADYSFHDTFPKLYKYRVFSNYAVEDIIDKKITLSSIGEFNDLFEGSFHKFGSDKEILDAAEKEWQRFENLRKSAGLSEGLLEHDYYVNLLKGQYKEDSRLDFRTLDFIGTFVGCLSSKNDSTLMWSHYADSNKGICIEYDFNSLPENHLYRKMIFPVAYSNKPIYLLDLLNDDKCQICEYPIDTAVICTAINKSKIWEYENEWRLVFIAESFEHDQRIKLNSIIKPSSICFGYHFLKSFFYYNYSNDHDNASNKIKLALKLLDYMGKNNITAKIMIPQIKTFNLKSISISVTELKNFIIQNFSDNEPENIRYYYTVHDELMDLLEQQMKR